MKLSELEASVMEMLLAGEDPTLCTLMDQLRVAVVKERELTGVGFYTTFQIPSDAPRLPDEKSFPLSDVSAQIDGLEHGAGFVVFVKNGALDVLEGYTFDEPWPEKVKAFQLSYMGKSMRDWTALHEQLKCAGSA